MIHIQCNDCEARFTATEKHAGKRGKCPKCGSPLTVPIISNPAQEIPPPAASSKRIVTGWPITLFGVQLMLGGLADFGFVVERWQSAEIASTYASYFKATSGLLAALTVWRVVVICYLVGRRPEAPNVIENWLWGVVVFYLIDTFWFTSIAGGQTDVAMRSLVGMVIAFAWMTYFRRSKVVQMAFADKGGS
jgi:hypothetical protein